MFSKHIVGNWHFHLTSNDLSLFATWLCDLRGQGHAWLWPRCQRDLVSNSCSATYPVGWWCLLSPLSLSFLIYKMDGVDDL